MQNINNVRPICCLCGKTIKLLGIEDVIMGNHKWSSLEFENINYYLKIQDFKDDLHLACRVKCAKYYMAGLRPKWLENEEFIVTTNNKEAHDYIQMVKKMSYEQIRHRGIYLYGQPGVGKTHLLANLCIGLIERTTSLSNITWANTSSILTQLRSSFGKKYEYGEPTIQETTLKKLKTTFLFLDDIGTESASDWAKEFLYDVINDRYEQRLPTFISSNLSPQELSNRLGDKFASRIVEMCKAIRIEGEDWRLKKADIKDHGSEGRKREVPIFSFKMAYWDQSEEYKKIVRSV